MDVTNTRAAGATPRDALAEVDRIVALVQEAGYPMPARALARNDTELRLLALAGDVVTAERQLALVKGGLPIVVVTGTTRVATDEDYWLGRIAQHREKLAEAVPYALTTLDGDR
jgi:hypothetical protein